MCGQSWNSTPSNFTPTRKAQALNLSAQKVEKTKNSNRVQEPTAIPRLNSRKRTGESTKLPTTRFQHPPPPPPSDEIIRPISSTRAKSAPKIIKKKKKKSRGNPKKQTLAKKFQEIEVGARAGRPPKGREAGEERGRAYLEEISGGGGGWDGIVGVATVASAPPKKKKIKEGD